MSEQSPISYAASARRTIRMEAAAVADLEQRIDADFENACKLLLQVRGRIIVRALLHKSFEGIHVVNPA